MLKEDIYFIISKRIKEERKRLALTQEEVDENISKILQGLKKQNIELR